MSKPANGPAPDPGEVLRELKDFQRLSVDYVYRRLYEDEDSVDRFLIADEVGLGKTLVARGVIARALQKLWKEVKRIDIIYICSNGDIARQNIRRLQIPEAGEHILPTRITLLPVKLGDLEKNKVNLVSFTPGTSFHSGHRTGIGRERAMLYSMLRKEWGFGDSTGPKNFFQCGMGRKNWRRKLKGFDPEIIDPGLRQGFLEELRKHGGIKEHFERLLPYFAYYKKSFPRRKEQLKLIGELRTILARSCLKALEPDLVILDEFQRFRDLLDGEDPGALLARTLFQYEQVKVLLLSATPYKMYTMNHELEDNHYRDFIRTVRFLFDSDAKAAALGEELQRYRLELFRMGRERSGRLEGSREAVERELRRVMVRTERLAVSEDRDGMLETKAGLAEMAPEDLLSFKTVDQLSRLVGAQDTVEYWKSAPYLLNLMERRGYKLKEKLVQRIDSRRYDRKLFDIISGAQGLLTRDEIAQYEEIDPNNARLRSFIAATLAQGSWKLLWVPPALPYYSSGGTIFNEGRGKDFTKALVFSSWKVVPKIIAALCSYEAERRMTLLIDSDADYFEERRRRRPLLRFTLAQERLTGMPNLNLLYPCWTLAAGLDPLEAALGNGRGSLPSLEQVKKFFKKQIEQQLQPLLNGPGAGRGARDEQWYWAALALLDREYSGAVVSGWLGSIDRNLAWRWMVEGRGEDDEDSRFAEHVDQFYRCFCEGWNLGRPPDDLVDVLAKTALASPAVAALRSLMRLYPAEMHEKLRADLMAAAARIALGFRSMFNLAESIALIRGKKGRDGTRYWESVLDYCCEGNLQAVMDEYVHILRDDLGLLGRGNPARDLQNIAGEIQTALSIRTVSLSFDELKAVEPGRIELKRAGLRCLYALRFGQEREDDQDGKNRPDQVRRAFNSPFRPFVLATTSIGQEGLDFHQYCHDLYHWNLPVNPVDLEQREGRVHRYKGHAIRRNIAEKYGLGALAGLGSLEDPWERLFQIAVRDRGAKKNDLVPFWIFEGSQKIRRNVPALPLSREVQLLDNLRSALVSYRMVFGQPRQEDLLNCIHRSGGDLEPAKLAEYRIDLSPMLPEGERESLSVTAGPGTPKEKKLYRKSSLQLRPAGEENCGPGRITYIDPQECEALVKCWKRYPGRDWVNGYLELVRELLERAGLDSDDERLAMTIRSSKKLPVTINRRYVIRAAPSGRIGLIMPLDAVLPAGKVKEKVLYEDYFYKSGTRDAWWAVFDQENDVRLSPKVKQLWTEAALREVEAGKRSPYRKHHRPIFYWAVHDLKIREILLNDAFPEISPERFL